MISEYLVNLFKSKFDWGLFGGDWFELSASFHDYVDDASSVKIIHSC